MRLKGVFFVFLGGLCLFLFGCSSVDKLEKEIADLKLESQQWRSKADELKDEIKNIRVTVASTADVISLSIPGERYLRLIDALHGSDERKKEDARNFLKSLMGTDSDLKLNLTAIFKWSENVSTISADVFTGLTNSEYWVSNHIRVDAINLRSLAKNDSNGSFYSPLESRFSETIRSFLNDISGDPTLKYVWVSTPKEFRYCYWPDSIFPNFADENGAHVENTLNQQRAAIVNRKNYIAGKYSKMLLNDLLSVPTFSNGNQVSVVNWNILHDDHYVFIVIPEDVYKTCPSLTVDAYIHPENNPSLDYFQNKKVFSIKDFKKMQNQPADTSSHTPSLYWAVHNFDKSYTHDLERRKMFERLVSNPVPQIASQ